MRRHPAFRLIAAFLALWFGLNSAEPELLHACPIHSATHQHSMNAHSMHAAGDRVMAHGHGRTPSPRPHQCSCPGDCCVAAIQLVDMPRVLVVAPSFVRAERTIASHESAIRPSATGTHVIPFSNGPPAIA